MKQTALTIFDCINKINNVRIDINTIYREYAIYDKELEVSEFLKILKDNDYRAKYKTAQIEELKKYPLPIIFLISKNNEKGYGLILGINYEKKRLLYFLPEEKESKEISFEDFQATCSNQFIIVRYKTFNKHIEFGFKWFLNEILRYKQVLAEVLLGSFIVQIFGLITPLFTQVILDKVIVHHSLTTLNVLAVSFVIIAIFELLLNLSRNYIFLHTANKLDAKLSAKLLKHLFSLPFNYFETRKVGNIVARVRELDNVREFITNKCVSVIIDTIFCSIFVIIMLLYSLKLTLISLFFILGIAIIYVTITPELRARLDNKFQMAAQSNSYLVETTTGVQTVKSLSIEGNMQKKWEEYIAQYVSSTFNLGNLSNFTNNIFTVLQKLMTISILFFGVKLVIENKLTIGQLIAFQMFSNQLFGPIMRLLNLWNEFQQALLAIDRLGDILNHPIEIESSKSITLNKLEGRIRFENVSFKYTPASPLILKNINFTIDKNTSVGIVGHSGSGKSTITKLIQRLYLINEGAIFLDGIDVRHISPLWLRYNIGVVLQENYLFSGSIKENISMPKPNASMEEIIAVSKIAGADNFISQLPEGYNTIVGERGSTLSGGQKQRIAIARALITNPRILIFDEATSALDYESEHIINQNINRIKSGRTMIVIAHRLSMVKNCDNIIVIKNGSVFEEGTHEKLIQKNGYYKYLCEQQECIVNV